jgi:ribosomal protein S18 acetylase RimI-like enzyme
VLTLPRYSSAGSRPASLSVSPDGRLGSSSVAGAGLVLNIGAMTTPPTYRIRPAEPDDQAEILRLIGSSAAWLRERKNTDQWTRPWPNRYDRDARIAQGITDGLTWMVQDGDGALTGTVTCREHGNDKLWTPAEMAERAAYVSRLIISRDHAGLGIGAALIHWAAARAVDGWGADWIRVDVWTTNSALHRYYKDLGFEHMRTLDFPDPWEYPSAALFQKPAADAKAKSAGWFQMAEEASLASR